MAPAQDPNYYLDRTGMEGFGVIVGGKSVVFTGVSVHQEPERYRAHEVLTPFWKEDFHFFFGQEGPQQNFYAVPAILVLGYDSAGGYFITTETDVSFEKNFPLFYLSTEQKVYFLTEESSRFLTGEYRWRESLQPTDAIRIFPSREKAEEEFQIHDRRELDLPAEGEEDPES